MKFHNNGKDSFIATSNDILVNGKKTDILTNIIEEQDDKLNKLEKNIKWLYKYGGTGSKGSGSGSSSQKLSLSANILFGNSTVKNLTDQKIIISDSSKDYETLSITLSSANILNTYKVRISHGGSIIYDPSTGNKDWSLNQNNDFSVNLNIPLNERGNIIIQFTASSSTTGEQISEQYKFTYIKNPYVINLSIVNDIDEDIIENGNLYVNKAKENGINFSVDYNIASSKSISYELIYDTENMLTNNSGIINDSEHGIGLGSIMIPFNENFILNDNNYGFHTITIKFKIDPDESLGIITGQIITKNISFTYVPDDQIFFKIEPANANAKIYKYNLDSYNNAILNFNLYKDYYECFKTLDNEQILDDEIRQRLINELVDESQQSSITDLQLKEILSAALNEIETNTYIYNVGSLQLYLQAYLGSNVLNSVDVSYIITKENVEDEEGITLLESLQYRKRQLVSIPIYEEGVYKLCIYSKNQDPSKRIVYYFVAFDKNSGINWYNADVEFNKINLYYRQGKIGSNTKTNVSYIKKYENVHKIQKYSNGQPSDLFNIINEVNSNDFEPNCDIMLSFGIQYSYINDNEKPLLSILTNNTASSLNLDIYQNKITANGSSDVLANIFIPKEHDYAPSNEENYHLLTLYKRYIYETNAPYYEIIIYIDGCPEAAFKNFVKDASCWSNVTLNNSNFSLNFFEISFFKHNRDSKTRFDKNELSNTVIQNKVTYLDDIAIAEYYYKYVSSRKNLNSIISLLSNLRNFKETNYGMIEVASMNDIDSIANSINIPVLLFEYSEQSDGEFINWFTAEYKETTLTKDKKRLDNIYYSPGLNKLAQINLPTELGDSYWYIALQGSSTGEFFDKNLTLGIVNSTAGYMGIFTPNFYDISSDMFANYDNLSDSDKEKVIKAKNSFLPETAFTLKADVVDSSHSNNTSVGAFVNANTTQFDILFDGGATNKSTNKYVNYIKNCLLGFPVLVFINVNRGEKSNYYFLGIYNFNLGRDSYFNMGYYSPSILKDQQQIVNTLNNANGNTFKVTYVSLENEQSSSLEVNDGVIVAEIQGGKEYFDFSQYHDTILLPQQVSQGSDNGCMFGDFVPKYDPAKSSNADMRIRYHIPRLVKSVAKAGGYLFSTVLQKHLGEYKYRYNKYIDKGQGSSIFDSANQVPNYLLQYTRSPQEADPDLQYLIHNFVKENNSILLDANGQPSIDPSYRADILDVGRLIDDSSDETDINIYGRGSKPILDYISLTEYYTVCMGFGLVDSVMKNLNVKSWDATYGENADNNKTGKWYVGFYDMDTSFGRDNAGAKTSYFAFSDYWKTNKSSELEQPTIYRDFYPMADPNNPYVDNQSMKESGFDIPSSYLFAVAKYAHLLNTNGDEHQLVPEDSIPHNIWARWRNVDNNTGLGLGHGELRSAEYFINKYFIRNLDLIPEQLWALNYRLKYLKRITTDNAGIYNYTFAENENGSFENTNFTPFHGKGINELHEWLNGRLHILDSYFNLEGNDKLNIKYLDYKTKESEEPLYEFTPIVKVDGIKGYTWNDIKEPVTDSVGNYMWLNTNNYEYIPNINSDTLRQNKDIEILKDIFSTTGNGARYSQPIDLYIKAQEYSPFNITTAMGEKYKYLLEDPNKEYHITYKPSGLQITKFGGSTLWTYIKNLNTVINENTLTLNTEALDQIILTRGIVSTYNIQNMKSLKYVSIVKDLYDSDSKFSGTLNFEVQNNVDPYPDLTTIELIRTEITLTVDGEGVVNINLTGTKSLNTNIENCKNLEKVILTNFTAPSLVITPGWSNNMIISNTSVNEMKLSPKDKTAVERRISISSDKALTSIILDGFTHISIDNCPNLYNICILQPENVKSLEITNCNNTKDYHNLNIYYNESTEIENGKPIIPVNEIPNINLEALSNIQSFKFSGTLGFDTVDASTTNGEQININGNNYNCIRLYTNAFSNTSLSKIITRSNVYLYIDSDNENGTTATFENSGYGIYTNKFIVGSNVRKLNSLFAHDISGINYSKPNILSDFASDFLNCNSDVVIFENIDNITSLEYIFYGQSQVAISTSTSGENNHPISLHNFRNVNNINYMLFATSVTSFPSEFFGYDYEYCGMNVINSNNEFSMLCFIPTFCAIDSHIFDHYINNVKTLISDNEYIRYKLNIIGYVTGSVFNISDLFKNLNYTSNILTSFTGLSFNDNIIIDWSNLLYDYTSGISGQIKFKNLKLVSYSFNSDNKLNTNYSLIGLNKLNISEIRLYNSFNFSVLSNEKISITDIIDYETLSDYNPILPWHETLNSLSGAKTIDEVNIIPLLKLLDRKKCVSINNLFKDTYIIVDENKTNINELILSDNLSVYQYFRNCISLFENAKFIDNNGNIYGFEITKDSLASFNKVINWSRAFYGCTLHKNLPLNMFNLKSLDKDYVIGYYDAKILDLSSMFENTKLDSTESWFNYDWTTEDINKYNNGVQLNGSYRYLIKTLTGLTLTNPKSIDRRVTELGTYYGENIIHNLILPWDIFYGCTLGCNINNFISNSDFEGILPSNMFPQNSRISNLFINNVFKNTLVVPNYVNEVVIEYKYALSTQSISYYTACHAYVFVPKNFTNTTYLINAFNFKMLLPNSESLDTNFSDPSLFDNSNYTVKNNDQIELYFVLRKDSVNFSNLSSIKNFLPIDEVITEINEDTMESKTISLHHIDLSIDTNRVISQSGVDVGFNAKTDYGIHYYMYFNDDPYNGAELLKHIDDASYPWIEKIIQIDEQHSETIYLTLNRNNSDSDTGLPLAANTKLLYSTIFNEDIMSFAYGPIISTSLNIGSIQPINGAEPFISISEPWSDFSHNIVLPLNERNGSACYENVFRTSSYRKTLDLSNIFNEHEQSLINYDNSNEYISANYI